MPAKNIRLPSGNDMNSGFDLAKADNSGETAQYMRDKVLKLSQKVKDPELFEAVIKCINEVIDWLKLSHNSSDNLWAGKIPRDNTIATIMDNRVADAVKALESQGFANNKENQRQIKIDYAFNDQGQLLRGYSSSGNPLESESVANMDVVFDSLLAENQLMVDADNHSICQAELAGGSRQKTGAATKEQIQSVFDKLPEYAQSKGIDLIGRQHKYPTAAPEQLQQTQTAAPEAPEPSEPASPGNR